MRFLNFLTKLVKKNLLPSVILLVGFLLRIISTTPGYYYPHGDELLYGQAINMIVKHTLSLESQYFGFPPLIPWIMLVVFALIFIPFASLITLLTHWSEFYLPLFLIPSLIILFLIKKIFHLNIKKTIQFGFLALWVILILGGAWGLSVFPLLQREVLGRDWIKALYWGRYLTAFVGTLVILATYKLSEFFFNKKVAILSALFVSLNYRLILNSHVGLPDTYNVFFLLLSLITIGYLLKKHSFKNYLAVFFSLAAFFMIKYQSHPLFPFLIVHTTVSIREAKRSFTKFFKNFFSKYVIIAGLLALIFVLVSHYYHFKNLSRTIEINNYEAIKYDFGRKILDLYPVSYYYHVGIGASLSILSVLGIILGLIIKKTRFATIILTSTLPTFAFLYLYYTNGGFFTRNLISTIPFLLIFAAFFVDQIYNVLKKFTPRLKFIHAAILIVFLSIVLSGNIINSITTAVAYSREAPRILAQKWVDQNIKDGSYARYQGYPTPTDPNVQIVNLLPYNKAFSYREYVGEKFDYVSVEMSNLRDQWVWWTRQTPDIEIKFWNKPDNLLSQTFYSLAFRELLWEDTQSVFISPWQAPSHNVVIMRMNRDLSSYNQAVLIGKFTNFDQHWTPLYYLSEYKSYLKKEVDNKGSESLYLSNARHLPGTLRFQSDPIVVKPGFGYKIVAKIKNDKTLSKEERDGFVRLDFYKDKLVPDILSRSTISFVSERVFGESDWHEVTLYGTAPEGSGFATMSFQSDGISPSSFYLNSIEIYETKNKVNDIGNHFIINDSQLFLPNNEGIL